MQHVVSQLITKKEELSGELNFYKTKISQLEEVLNGIDISIKVFDPDFKLCSVKAKRFTGNTHYFKRGESHVLVLDTLRKSQKPMKTHEIVIELMKKKELDYQDLTLVEKVKKTLLTTLKKQEKNNLIKVVDSSNGFTWAI
ncbi:MAG: hypothetical protein M0Q88_10045 [Bacilli bacterium]|nr:hypothetical protein [Bacilli bacterium]